MNGARGNDGARRGSLLTGSAGGVWVALASTVMVFGGAGADRRQLVRVAGGQAHLLRPGRVPGVLQDDRPRVRAEHQDLPGGRGADPDPGAVAGGAAQPAGAGVLPDPAAGDRLHRPVPGHPHDPAGAAVRVRHSRAASLLRHHQSGVPGRRRAGGDLHGVRVGGLPGRHRVGAPQPGGGGQVAGADPRADDADGDPAPGGAARDPAAPERLHRAAEGHGADLGAGPGRGAAAGEHRVGERVQLHALRGGGVLLRADHGAAGAADRLADRSATASGRWRAGAA